MQIVKPTFDEVLRFGSSEEEKTIVDRPLLTKTLKRINFGFIGQLPYYGHLMASSVKQITPTLDAVAGMRVGKFLTLYFHETGFFKLDEPTQRFVICHELLHFEFQHPWRAEPFKNIPHIIVNVAMDLAINSYLVTTAGFPKPNHGVFPSDFELEDGKTFEWYLSKLRDKINIIKISVGDGPSIGGDGGAHDWGVDVPADEAGALAGRMHEAAMKAAGETSLGLLRDFYLRKAEVPWQMLVKNIIQADEMTHDWRFTKRKTSRRYGDPPGVKHDYLGELHKFVDTSGSMSEDEIGQCFGVVEQFRKLGYTIFVHEFDAVGTHPPYLYKKLPPQVHGGGGTKIRPALEECKKLFPRVKEAIVLTDGGIFDLSGPPPEGFNKVHWLLTSQGHHLKMPDWGGQTILIKTN